MSTEQWQICVEHQPETREVRGNPPRMRIWNQWLYQQYLLLLTLFLRLMREYEQKIAELPEQQKLTKLCSNAVFSKNVEKGQFSMTLDEERLDDMSTLCRQYTLPQSDESSQLKGWILGNTKIGPVLDVKVCYHQGRYGVEIMIESLFRDRTVSWVRIVI